MNDLKDLLSRLKVESSVDRIHYVYYNKDTKRIHKVAPKEELSDYECFSIATEKVEPILNGQVRTEDYYVYFDYGLKAYSIQRRFNENFSNISLIEVPFYGEGDLSITVDSKYIKFNVVDDLKSHLEGDISTLHFIITERNNPYMLYDKCDIVAKTLLENNKVEHQLSEEQLKRGLSIYTNPVFSTYSFKVDYD
jgi:hypothetical protein